MVFLSFENPLAVPNRRDDSRPSEPSISFLVEKLDVGSHLPLPKQLRIKNEQKRVLSKICTYFGSAGRRREYVISPESKEAKT